MMMNGTFFDIINSYIKYFTNILIDSTGVIKMV